MTGSRSFVWGGVMAAGALALAACGSSGGSTSSAHTSTSTSAPSGPTTTVALQAGSGATAKLAEKLQAARLGCADYRDVPQNPSAAHQAGILDVGNCGLGHLGVFSTQSARDAWVNTQVSSLKMADCALGREWAVCLFPHSSVTKIQVQSALDGTTVT